MYRTSLKHNLIPAVLLIFVIGISIKFKLHSALKNWANRFIPIKQSKLALFYNQRPRYHKILRYHQFADDAKIQKELKKRLEYATEKKIIIFWSPPAWGRSKLGQPNRANCGNCEVTYDRSLMRNNRTGAFVYHFDSIREDDMPKWRNPKHLHIFWVMEASSNVKMLGYTFETEDAFGMNATMSYRIDSDFSSAYGGGRSLNGLMANDDTIYKRIMQKKSKLAIAVISDCSVTVGARIRLGLINQLKSKGLRIDTFGNCFSNKITKEELQDIAPRYKFFFSYENSYHCSCYITEKFFVQGLHRDMVPVVWGAVKQDYETIAPPGSFIYAEEFETPRHLIDYLEYLDQNDEEYLKFFRWRTMKPDTVPMYHRTEGFCAICRAVHGINVDYRFNPNYNRSSMPLFSDGIARRTVPSVGQFLYNDDNHECFDIFDKIK